MVATQNEEENPPKGIWITQSTKSSAYLGGASEREEEEEADREQRRHWLALGHVLERLMHGRPIETTRIEAV